MSLKINLKKWNRHVDVGIPGFNIYFNGKEGPGIPLFLSVQIWNFEFGVDREFKGSWEDGEYDHYRLYFQNLNAQKIKTRYFPWKK